MSRLSTEVTVLALIVSTVCVAAESSSPGPTSSAIPLIDVTDLYHPHQDVGDNVDILAAYALPELDLRAVILDCTEPFRQPVAKDPGLFPDARGPREPGFIPVWQLNYVWETAVWICLSGRKLVKRADGTCRIVPAAEIQPTDKVLPNELRPCLVTVRDDGIYEYRETAQPTNFSVYYRGDPRQNETALREALPALYLSFRPSQGTRGKP